MLYQNWKIACSIPIGWPAYILVTEKKEYHQLVYKTVIMSDECESYAESGCLFASAVKMAAEQPSST